MKIVALLCFVSSFVFANVYYSKVEPYEVRKISSNVSGEVLYSNENMIGKKLSNKAYIIIDSKLDEDELQAINEKLKYYRSTLQSDKKILLNLEETLKRKRENYKKVKVLKIKSRVEKDKEFYDLINSENSYLNTQKAINSLKTNIADLEFRAKQLRKTIDDKHVKAQGYTLYSLDVKPGQVVSFSTPLASVADTSKALLTIYLDDDDLENLDKKSVYINGKKTDYKIDRVVNIADTKNISKYRAQIIIQAPKIFSKLAKVELKETMNE
ncbi:HlyD family efflux transporter periplasmic adaptor subunit [Sulfurimonas sp.]